MRRSSQPISSDRPSGYPRDDPPNQNRFGDGKGWYGPKVSRHRRNLLLGGPHALERRGSSLRVIMTFRAVRATSMSTKPTVCRFAPVFGELTAITRTVPATNKLTATAMLPLLGPRSDAMLWTPA